MIQGTKLNIRFKKIF